MDSTAQVNGYNFVSQKPGDAPISCMLITCVFVQMSTSASLVMEDVNTPVRILLGTSTAPAQMDTAWTVI